MVTKDTIVSILKRCITSLEKLSNTQQLDDKSLRSRKWFSSSSHDVYVRQTSQKEYYRLTVSTVSGNHALIDMKYFFRRGNSYVMSDPQEPTATAPIVSVSYKELTPLEGVYRYDFAIFSNLNGYPPPHNVYIKFLFRATDEVTWQWQKL